MSKKNKARGVIGAAANGTFRVVIYVNGRVFYRGSGFDFDKALEMRDRKLAMAQSVEKKAPASERIVAAIKRRGPLSRRVLAQSLNIDLTTVYSAVQAMIDRGEVHEADPGTEWRPKKIGKTRLIALGPASRENPRATSVYVLREQAILDHLKDNPNTALKDLASLIGAPLRHTWQAVDSLRKQGVIHVSGYVYGPIRGGRPARQFSLGPGPDAPFIRKSPPRVKGPARAVKARLLQHRGNPFAAALVGI